MITCNLIVFKADLITKFHPLFVCVLFSTHFDPSFELTDPSLESLELCLTSLPPGAGKVGMTSQLR